MAEVVKINDKPKYPALMTTNTPLRIERLHNCMFNPVVYLNRGSFYYIAVRLSKRFVPKLGFYDVPEKGFITWVREFKFIAVSQPHVFDQWCEETGKVEQYKHWAFIFEAFEGTAPAGTDGIIR